MNKQIYIFSLILIAATFFNISSLKAEDRNPNADYNAGSGNSNNNNNESDYSKVCQNNGALKTDPAPGTTSASAKLPINNGIVFLMIAGVIIGITTLKKYKSPKPALVAR